MSKIRSMLATQSSVGEPERRGDERSEAARSGGSSTLEPDVGARPAGFRGPRAPRATALYDRLQAGDPPAGGRLYPARRARRAPAEGGALLVAPDHLAPAARGRVDAEETRTEGDGRSIRS